MELVAILALSFVDDDDPQPTGQERRLTQALEEGLHRPLELLLVEDLEVGQERDRRSGVLLALRLAHDLEVAGRLAAGELLTVDLSVAAHLDPEPLRERVHHRHAHAVQAAGNLVALAAELPAGVQLRQDDGDRWDALVA